MASADPFWSSSAAFGQAEYLIASSRRLLRLFCGRLFSFFSSVKDPFLYSTLSHSHSLLFLLFPFSALYFLCLLPYFWHFFNAFLASVFALFGVSLCFIYSRLSFLSKFFTVY